MSFSWEGFFDELLSKLCSDFNSESLAKLAHKVFPDSPLKDQFKDGSSGPVKEFDPLTFIGYFNRGEGLERRIGYCKTIKTLLSLRSPVPTGFEGIPVINNQASWFFPYDKERSNDVFPKLWEFAKALEKNKVDNSAFADALSVKGVGLAKLTQICFICRPTQFLPLDKNTTQLLASKGLVKTPGRPAAWRDRLTFEDYKKILDTTKQHFPSESFAQISARAYESEDTPNGVQYWIAGAHWKKGENSEDKTREFVEKGVWLNGFGPESDDPSIETVKRVRPGDQIAIKSSFTKGKNHDITVTRIKAIGVIRENFGDGVRLSVDWKYQGPAFDVEGVSYRKTFEPVRSSEVSTIFGPMTGNGRVTMGRANSAKLPNSKNLIFWGPPGTGKTYQLLQMQRLFEDQSSGSKDKIVSWVQEATWWDVIAAALIDLGKPVTVPELYEHEFVQLKAKQSTTKTPKNTIWGALQAHTVTESKTVNFERRQEPLVVDKTEDSKWSLAADWESQLADLVTDVRSLRSGKSDSVDRRYKVVTFHQSYSYEEFVEGIRPEKTPDGSGVTYQVKDGVFKLLCQRASENPDKQYALFIDEINRGNISKIFGELITLIEEDKRSGSEHAVTVTLPYSGQQFSVPKNLYIIGTMNSVDRSIALVDMALRRRFEFVAIRPQAELIEPAVVEDLNIRAIFQKLNNKISVVLGSEYQIGHSYFMSERAKSLEGIRKVWFGNILPLLQEYLFDDWEKLEALVGDFVVRTEVKDLEKFALPKSSFGAFVASDIPDDEFLELMGKLA